MNNNGKYDLSVDGIQDYFKNAVNQIPISGFSTLHDITDDDYDFFSYQKEHNILPLLYHSELDKQKTLFNKYQLWYKRLKHICSALTLLVINFGVKSRDIEMGIFGSNNPSSDIDIGISYKKGTKLSRDTIKLSQIVDLFESLFINKKYTTLDLDVEMYADYFISLQGEPYLTTTIESFTKTIPFLIAGILKNNTQALYDIKDNRADIRRSIGYITSTHFFEPYNVIHKLTLSELKTILIDCISSIKNTKQYSIITDIIHNYITPEHLTEGKEIVLEYLTLPYNIGRFKYYEKLDDVHKLYESYHKTKSAATAILLNEAISYALIFRAESYICSASIYHVVYSMQANPDKNTKIALKKLIQNEGYYCSVLEQLSYLSSYYKIYHNKKKNNINKAKYIKKYKKYMGRLQDACSNIVIPKTRRRKPKRQSLTRKKRR
jgi:hypothetical protein